MRTQLKRAKGRTDSHDLQLHSGLVAVLSDKDDGQAGLDLLERLAEKLDLKTPGAIRQENRALQEVMSEKQGLGDEDYDDEMSFPRLFSVLRKLTSILPSEDTDEDTPELDRVHIAAGVFTHKGVKLQSESQRLERRLSQNLDIGVGAGVEKGKHTPIPDDFKCPISLDLMKDPVIVATGQVSSSSSQTPSMHVYLASTCGGSNGPLQSDCEI